jgi:hypothetical protein
LLEQHLDGDISNAFHAGCFELGIENVLLIITEIKYWFNSLIRFKKK